MGGRRPEPPRRVTTRVEHARIYDLPETPTPIVVSGFGPKAIELAGRMGDGLCHRRCPTATGVGPFRAAGGEGKVGPGWRQGLLGRRRGDGALSTSPTCGPTTGLPGELAQILPTPAHFEQASSLVTKEMLAESITCGPDVDRHVRTCRPMPMPASTSSTSTRSDPTRTRSSPRIATKCSPACVKQQQCRASLRTTRRGAP